MVTSAHILLEPQQFTCKSQKGTCIFKEPPRALSRSAGELQARDVPREGGSFPWEARPALPWDAMEAGFCLSEALQCSSVAKLPACPAWLGLWGWMGAFTPQGHGGGAGRALDPWHGQGTGAEHSGAVGSGGLCSAELWGRGGSSPEHAWLRRV